MTYYRLAYKGLVGEWKHVNKLEFESVAKWSIATDRTVQQRIVGNNFSADVFTPKLTTGQKRKYYERRGVPNPHNCMDL